MTPLFHLGLAPTSPLHYLSLWIFVTFVLLPPSFFVTGDCFHFWAPSSFTEVTKSLLLSFGFLFPSHHFHWSFIFFGFDPSAISNLPHLFGLLLRFSHPYLIHYSLTFAEDHFGLSRPFLFLTRSHISSLWSLSFDRAEDEIHNSGCRQNQPIIRSEKISWWLSVDERKIALRLRTQKYDPVPKKWIQYPSSSTIPIHVAIDKFYLKVYALQGKGTYMPLNMYLYESWCSICNK